ncbi:carbohydrate kinase family protein [Hymenobacter lucidus]|uniref:PfkB family carbohydrate kinase n=1 Tax=Hymenobacter lucidus TaxID=2880930 RepID=A0ABS8AXK1_9BACT|nr:PfkB family carbohydrate kinase [Hymenobacter lucidus]MCB2410503.1 PfkB family carbohydrate kinase [Hymenobacter lucidus]
MLLSRPIICFGEILWDMAAAGRRPAGTPLLLALQLQPLHPAVQLISRVGDDELGHALLAFSTRQGLDTQWVQRSETHVTGVLKTALQPGGEVSCKVVGPAAWDYIEYAPALRTAVEQAGMLIYDSLAARSFASRETLYRLLLHAPCKVFIVGLCAPHYSREVVKYLLQQADIVVLTQVELEEIMGWLGRSSQVATALPWLAGHFDLQAICVTHGAQGPALWAHHTLVTGIEHALAGPPGSGEAAFVAALLSSWLQAATPLECLRQACQAAAALAPDPAVYALR